MVHRNLLKPGDFLRARLPDMANREVRLKVFSMEGAAAMDYGEEPERFRLIAGYQDSVILDDRRAYERVNTAQYKDLLFQMGQTGLTFKVLDLGVRGMKIHIPPGENSFQFDIDAELPTSTILLGQNQVVNLRTTIPRHTGASTVGIQFEVDPSGKSAKLLEAFLNYVQQEELKHA